MSDPIERQAAIDALEKVAELFPWRVPGNRDTYDRYNEAWNDAIGRAEIEIEELPSAQPETNCSEIPNNWIPVEDKLPDNNTDVLLQFKSNMGVGFYENGDWAINTGDGIYSMVGYNEEKPIAWRPLPEPYTERKEG